MLDFSQSHIDRLDQMCKPMVKRTITLIGGISLLLVCLHLWSLFAARQAEIDGTATSTANMARALASHAERTMELGDAVLDEMVERAENGELTANGEKTPAVHLHARLTHIATVTPQIQELFIYGADGERLATSLPHLLAGNNSDREYFRYHQTHAGRGTYIGKPIRSRSTGILTIPLSRRIDRPDGSFGGVAMASLKLSFFGNFYDSFDVGKTGTIVLAIDDGTLLYRRPFKESMVGTNVSNIAIFDMYRSMGVAGTSMRVAKIDGIERLYSYRQVEGFPLLVAIAISREEILHEWWVVVIKMSGVVLVALALLGWGALRMVRQLKVREALEDQLRHARVKLEQQNEELQVLADSDGLTGMANRRHFEITLNAEYERARRNGQPCSLILIDVDHFKKFNDRYGHVAGDECLRRVARAIDGGTRRPTDLAARYGGEEFVVILPDTDLEGARAVAENIRSAVVDIGTEHADSPYGHITASLGVFTARPAQDDCAASSWVEAADAALYEAKTAGRNRVVWHAAEPCSAEAAT
ncbi:diguanylate cyclase [Massilia sp.]|uniref:sensor domain-containing diguanylate cyclase n=1 Tax=Massilia sp. TaxID=1882437 RepID=UPI0028A007CC|nr:diguanylate cyclase [Massilia sp.]